MQFLPPRKDRLVYLNVTSLVDVMFLLVLFFLVSTTFKNQPSIDLSLPRSSTAQESPTTPTVIYLTRDGRLFLDDEAIERTALGGRLRELQAATGEDRVVLRADEHAEHGAVVDLIDIVKESGFRRVSLAARPQGGS
ncbi:MAG TPA: biopolymer transporter ExbD [Candidatus Krumholzibacteria bacterium]|nr:biopolymer transporter ExbD [Candidatus Krumholzibacteria bacterium]HPD72708.1 biopolymer transporter ExbD [Candidatus Krumholzibacteria bacterium]HRY40360.1 biopolymer transporter ExbD [Candidatus Krumholzibacteria bacterium]